VKRLKYFPQDTLPPRRAARELPTRAIAALQHELPERGEATASAHTTVRLRTLLLSMLTIGAAGWLATACAGDPPGLGEIPPGEVPSGNDGAGQNIVDPCVKNDRCGDQCACGEGCCPDDGSVCVGSGARCWLPGQSCETTADCAGADTYCNNGTCFPYLSTTPKQSEDSCRVQADLPSLVPEIKCQWPTDDEVLVLPESVQVGGTPMVIDFDFDNDKSTSNPSIVFVSYTLPYSTQSENGVLRVIDGKTCKTQATIVNQFPIPADASVALGNLDLESCPDTCPDERGDARPEIVFPVIDRTGASPRPHIVAYRYVPELENFDLWWDAETTTAVETLFSIAIDDLDGDGNPEVITADQVIAPNGETGPGEVLFTIPFQGGRGLIEPPIVVDITGDRFPDVVTSQGIYVWDVLESRLELGEFWPENNPSSITAAFTAVANLNDELFDPLQGDQPEMVVVDSTGAIVVMNIAGQILHRSNLPGGVGGPPTIADFDGDGRMEFASAGANNFTVFDLDCRPGEKFNREGCNGASTGNANAVLWSQRSKDGGTTGSSVFDFDGNGSAEVVYADECFMRIYDGKTGNVLQSVPRSSRTGFEYPVIADVDGDGHAEIVVGSNDSNPGFECPATDRLKPETRSQATHGLTVWGNDGWAGSRPIWNQYSYYVTHVRDDGTIPPGREVPRFWMPGEGTNSFRENTQGTTPNSFSFNQADLTTVPLPEVPCISSSNGGFNARITLNMCNRGLQPIPANGAEVSLMDMADASRPAMCTVRNGTELASGGCQQLICSIPATSAAVDIEVVGDPSNRVSECFENNNRAQVLSVRCDDITIQ
jgi:hypothetical protein